MDTNSNTSSSNGNGGQATDAKPVYDNGNPGDSALLNASLGSGTSGCIQRITTS